MAKKKPNLPDTAAAEIKVVIEQTYHIPNAVVKATGLTAGAICEEWFFRHSYDQPHRVRDNNRVGGSAVVRKVRITLPDGEFVEYTFAKPAGLVPNEPKRGKS